MDNLWITARGLWTTLWTAARRRCGTSRVESAPPSDRRPARAPTPTWPGRSRQAERRTPAERVGDRLQLRGDLLGVERPGEGVVAAGDHDQVGGKVERRAELPLSDLGDPEIPLAEVPLGEVRTRRHCLGGAGGGVEVTVAGYQLENSRGDAVVHDPPWRARRPASGSVDPSTRGCGYRLRRSCRQAHPDPAGRSGEFR